MEADYSRLPFPSEKKRNITWKKAIKEEEEEEEEEKKKKTKNKESLPDYDPGKRTANRSRQGRDTQFRSIDLSFMSERKSEESERERILKKKNQSKRHAPTENEREVSYVPISSHTETKQKG